MENEKRILENFLLDINCLEELNPYLQRVNIFDILKSTRTEIRHSNVLAWLLDATESHGLGKEFCESFVREVVRQNRGKFDVEKWLFLNYDDQKVFREWHPKKDNSLDILIVFKESTAIIAIENKVDSNESENQTNTYSKELKKNFESYEKMEVFLTPSGDDAQDSSWFTFTYLDIQNILEPLKEKINNPTAKLLIENYLEVIGCDIVENKEIIELCTKIYNENKDALDLIYKYKKDAWRECAAKIREVIKELSEEDNSTIKYDEKYNSGDTYVRFSSRLIDEKLGVSNSNNNIWKNNQRHLFELHPRDLQNGSDVPIWIAFTLDNYDKETEHREIELRNQMYKKLTSKDAPPGKRVASAKKEKNFWEDAEASWEGENWKEDLKTKIRKYIKDVEEIVIKIV